MVPMLMCVIDIGDLPMISRVASLNTLLVLSLVPNPDWKTACDLAIFRLANLIHFEVLMSWKLVASSRIKLLTIKEFL